jgi:hypothetical protein
MKLSNTNTIVDIVDTVTRVEKDFAALKVSCEANADYCKNLFFDHEDDFSRLKMLHEDVTAELTEA